MRQALGLKQDDVLIAETTSEGILLRPALTVPIEIYSPGRIREFDEAEADLAKVLVKKKGRRRAENRACGCSSTPTSCSRPRRATGRCASC